MDKINWTAVHPVPRLFPLICESCKGTTLRHYSGCPWPMSCGDCNGVGVTTYPALVMRPVSTLAMLDPENGEKA